MNDDKSRQLGLILTGIVLLLTAIGALTSVYFYSPSDGDGRYSGVGSGLSTE